MIYIYILMQSLPPAEGRTPTELCMVSISRGEDRRREERMREEREERRRGERERGEEEEEERGEERGEEERRSTGGGERRIEGRRRGEDRRGEDERRLVQKAEVTRGGEELYNRRSCREESVTVQKAGSHWSSLVSTHKTLRAGDDIILRPKE